MPSRPAYVTLIESAARTAATTTADFGNEGYSGIEVVIDITAVTSTPSVTFTLQGKDILSGKYYTILASSALSSVTTTVLRVFPGATASNNAVANFHLPAVWRLSVSVGNSDSATYSVGASLLP